MAEGWKSLDLGFPRISSDQSAKEQIENIYNYLFQMKQGLQVTLQTMDKSLRKLAEENVTLKNKIQELEKRMGEQGG